ncbi:MAG TPA: methyltransferase domain-containing protein [Gemmatimonadaceae bacterium]|jgi:SAM-dependent methyltransferase
MNSSQDALAHSYSYVGNELELFAEAVHWKRYFRSAIADRLVGDVLEVGAGIGETARHLLDGRQRSWLCLEPDERLGTRLRAWAEAGDVAPLPTVQIGTTADLDPSSRFDTILYIDVLEHIEDDRAEMARAAQLLAPRGALIVLSPAFQQLFSDFDRSVGHFRRYTRASLAEVMPPSVRQVRLRYLDSVGFLASLSNRALLRQALPTRRQIALWDRVMIPASRVLDPLLARSFGRSVLAVYERI